ncbi:MAG: YigZ family protein [Gammaproteobacteria bacterium]|nr:YigZ family protein [Gammaproteobacteria bacterium]
MTDTYEVPAAETEAELVVRKSRFIGRVFRVSERSQAMAYIEQLRAQHPQARHLCWAYLLGSAANSSAAMNDDGEPSGTAGRPILNVIQHKKLRDTLVIVVRYFGGIKLGAGGLTRAYSGATEAVLSQCPRQLYQALFECQLSLEFSQEADLRHWLECHQGRLLALDYGTLVVARIQVPQLHEAQLNDYVASMGMRVGKEPGRK